jgi:hypothetical protein
MVTTKESTMTTPAGGEQFTISSVPAALVERMNRLQGRLLALGGKRQSASRSAVGRRALELGIAVLAGEVAALEKAASPSSAPRASSTRRGRA